MDFPNKNKTFLFTDIEGSTKLWERFPEPMQAALACHDALLRSAIEACGGVVFKTVGDAFCAVFSSAEDAVSAALTAQRSLQAQEWGETGPLRVRMALHTGTAEERDGDYFGPVLNRVARLLAIGHGQQVLVSFATQEKMISLLRDSVSLRDLGSHRLKDLQEPEHVYQLVHSGLPSDFPPLRSLQAFANNLPVQVTSFIGREKEIEEIKQLLATARLLTLMGSGGCGKTRLSLQVAADLLEQYADGVWLIELAPLMDPALVPQAVASVLGLREEPGRPLGKTLTDYLHSRQPLLVLDNCEHLLPACAHLADALLKACAKVQILVSSREALGISGETTYRIPSLALPDSDESVAPDALIEYEAVRLFQDRAAAASPSFEMTGANIPAVVQICRRLDGIPLAIELAAARVRAMSADQIASRLDQSFRLLTGGSRTALPRQQTLKALIDWSYDLLSQQERCLLRRLSVFAGGWNLETAEKVCSDEEIEDWEILDLLTSLVDKSLVMYGEGEKDRYRLLETVKQYGRDRLTEAGEEEAMRRRHGEYCLLLAEEAALKLQGPEQIEWFKQLGVEHDNLRSALGWCLADKEGVEPGLRLAASLWRFWEGRGYLSEGLEHLLAMLNREGAEAGTKARADALNAAGNLASDQGDYTEARACYEESLSIRREMDDKQGIAGSLNNLGLVAHAQGDYTAARVFYEESLAICREKGDRQGIASSLNNLGIVARDQSDYAAARSYYEQALAINRKMGNRIEEAGNLANLGNVAREEGDYAAARSCYEEGLAINREIGDRTREAINLGNLGNVAYEQGDDETARFYYEQALSIAREIGNRIEEAGNLGNLGNVTADLGNYEDANSFYEQSLNIAREIGNRALEASNLRGLGNVACARGDQEKALTLYSEALTISFTLGMKRDVAQSLESLASLSARNGRTDHAARLWGTAESLREALGTPLSPNDLSAYLQDVAAARAALEEEIFMSMWAQGREAPLEQAISYALERIGT